MRNTSKKGKAGVGDEIGPVRHIDDQKRLLGFGPVLDVFADCDKRGGVIDHAIAPYRAGWRRAADGPFWTSRDRRAGRADSKFSQELMPAAAAPLPVPP